MIKKIFLIISVLFITSCKISESSIVELNNKWELFNEQFILSDNIGVPKSDNFLFFSGTTNKLNNNNVYLYGSIKQNIQVKKNEHYALYLSGVLSASRVWVDGKLLASYGEIGKTLESTRTEIKRGVLNFVPESDIVEIVIEFSNFHFKTKYLFKWIILGESSEITNLYIKNQSKDYFTTGLLVICAILFILMYSINVKDKYNLYFALFSLSFCIRSFLMKNTTIEYFIPSFTWVLTYQLTKASEVWALVFILLFFKSLYPEEFNNKVTNIIVISSLLMSFGAFIPLSFFNDNNILLYFQFQILISGTYIISRIIKSVLHNRFLSKQSLIAIILLFGSIIFDIFASRIFLLYDYYSAQFVLLLILIMFLLIGRKRSDSSIYVAEKQKINDDIRFTFTKFVPLEILASLKNSKLEDRAPGDYTVEALSMIYIDIRDFTKLSEGLTPQENFLMINEFYEIVGNEVVKNGGYIESYGGDGVKAIFSSSPDDAINSALNISDEVAITSKIKIGMSVHFGKVVLGTIGSNNRIQATAVSDVTRILSAMDSFNSKMGIEILLTDKSLTLSNISQEYVLSLGSILLTDEEDPIGLYQVIPKNYRIDSLFKEAFENGIFMIKHKKYHKALAYFELAERLNTNHQLTKYYISQLELFFVSDEIKFVLKV